MNAEPQNAQSQARAEFERWLQAARRRNERIVLLVMGPIFLVAAGIIYVNWIELGLDPPIGFLAMVTAGGLAYLALSQLWSRDLPIWVSVLTVTFEGTVGCLLTFIDTQADIVLARSSPVLLMPFVVLALALVRYRASLVIYSGLLSTAGMALLYPHLCTDMSTPFCMPLIYIWRPVLFLVTALITALTMRSVLETLALANASILRRVRIRKSLGKLVGEEVASSFAEVDEAAALQTERRQVTVMFIDFRSFTRFCEGRDGAEVVSALNEALERLIEPIRDQGGTVNKFLGDGLLALFGAPADDEQHTVSALNAARDILDDPWFQDGMEDDDRFDVAIGIHVGEVIAGPIGSRDRLEYTVIGDTVNVASRIESTNRTLGTRALISAATCDALPQSLRAKLRLRPVGAHPLKGRTGMVELFELQG